MKERRTIALLTQRTNLANLVTTIHSERTAETVAPGLAESFQSFVTEGNQRWNEEASATNVEATKPITDTSHKDAYEKEKVSTDSYSVSKEKVQNSVEEPKDTVAEELSEEDLAELQEGIRDVLKEALDMTDEEIDEILATTNLSLLSLLQPENLQEFLLTATENEPIDLLTNSSLIDVFQQMNTEMEALVQEMNIDTNQLEQIVTNELELLEQTDVNTSEVQTQSQEQLLPKDVKTEQSVIESEQGLEQTDEQTIQMETVQPEDVPEEGLPQDKNLTTTDTPEQFTVTEESTGIEVQVESHQNEQGQSAGQNRGQNLEQTQQGIAGDIVNQLSQAVNELEQTSVSFSTDVRQAEIIQQVIEQIRVTSGSDMNRIEVQLYPQHLGRVQIQVMMKNGVMTAQINAETEMAKEAIESQLQQLKETFQEKSIHVEAVEVSVGTSNFQREQDRQDSAKEQQGTQSRGRRLRLDEFGMPVDELTEEEQATTERLEAQGASVEFTA